VAIKWVAIIAGWSPKKESFGHNRSGASIPCAAAPAHKASKQSIEEVEETTLTAEMKAKPWRDFKERSGTVIRAIHVSKAVRERYHGSGSGNCGKMSDIIPVNIELPTRTCKSDK
jgi:hypothetical protein